MSRKFNKLVVLSVVVSMMLSFSIPATALPVSAPVTTPAVVAPSTTPQVTAIRPTITEPQVGTVLDKAEWPQGALPKTGSVKVVIELADEPAAATYAAAQSNNRPQAEVTAAVRTQLARIEAAQQALLPTLDKLGATVIYRTQRAYNGIGAIIDAEKLSDLAQQAGVKAVHPLVSKTLDNWHSVPLIGAAELWNEAGVYGGLDGSSVSIGIIDSGVDYGHADFGGLATEAAYLANDTTVITDTYLGNLLYPTMKVAGGWDFAGDDYDADDTSATYQPIPHPDPDPAPCYIGGESADHGTHVAGTTAGYGVNADGSTYEGPYNPGIDFSTFKVGPGVAPEAELYSLRVFGCNGSTDVTDLAIDWAVDPNNDGDFSDHLDVINMSLGSSYGNVYDSSAVASDNAALAGVVVVASAGNSGDVHYVVGSPSVAERAISVAGSDDGAAVLDGFEVVAPAGSAGVYPASESVLYDWTSSDLPITGTLVYPLAGSNPAQNQRTGCYTYDITNTQIISGNIVLMDWDNSCTVGSVGRGANAVAAGAIGAIMVDYRGGGFSLYISGSPVIPAYSAPAPVGDELKVALAGGAVTAVMTHDHVGSVPYTELEYANTIYSSSSRGPSRNASALKPDITAPAVSIFSALNRTGTNGVSYNGTSMAAPHVAGSMALLKQLHPDWSVEELKALAMNTAVTDVSQANGAAPLYTPARIGAGRITLPNAASAKIIAFNATEPYLTSVSFGAVEVNGTAEVSKQIKVVNKSNQPAKYQLSYAGYADVPGVEYTVTPSSLNLPAYGTALVTVKMTADAALMKHTVDPTIALTTGRSWLAEESGYVVMTPVIYTVYLPMMVKMSAATNMASTAPLPTPYLPTTLRVPVYAAPRPAAAMAADGASLNFTGATGSATIPVTGTGIDTGVAYPVDILSVVSAFELAETSPNDAGNAELDNADLKYVGVTNNNRVATGGFVTNTAVYFGISTWGSHSTAYAGDAEFDIYIDSNRNGTWDYVVYNTQSGSDTFVTAVYNLSTGSAVADRYVNFTPMLDTYPYNNNVLVLPVSASRLGLSNSNPRFDYQVVTFSREEPTGAPVDVSAVHTYSAAKAGLDFTNGSLTGSAWDDLPGTSINVNFDLAAYEANGSQGALLLHHHNATGSREEVISVTTPANLVAVTLMHTNDFHGNLELSGSNPGIARLATKIKQVRNEVNDANTALLDAGDIMQSSLLSNLKKGEPTIDLYNYLGYDVATYGNHEFDWGQQVLISRTMQANFPFVVSNLVVNDTGNCATAGWTTPVSFTVKPWITMTVGAPGNQAVIGILGTASIETPYITIASATQGLCFKNPAESIGHWYNDVKAAGADVIVVLSHNGNTDGGYGYGFTVEGDQTLARRLVQQGTPANLIIGGHSHTDLAAAQVISGTTVVQAHYAGRKLGRADLLINTATDTASITWTRITVGTGDPEDAATKARVNVWAQDPAYQAQINQVVGFSNVDLVRNYNGDNFVGDLVNDSIYNDLNTDANPANDVDMVFNNAGGLRSDITNTVKPFTLTYGLMYSELPFGNATLVGDMKGWQIMELLNQSATLFKGALQVSGIRYAFYNYTDALPGPQPYAWGAYSVTVKDRLTQAWGPLVLTKTYRIATNEFLAPAGQDGFTPFKYVTNYSYYGDMLDGVNRWVSKAYSTTASAYNGPNGNGLLDGRILQESSIIPVTVLHHNDSHGRLLQSGTTPGYTNLATAINQERAHNPTRSILVSAGDNIQGDTMMAYYKTSYTGKAADGTTLPVTLTANPLITAFNAMTYTAYTLGNHEFNFGNAIFTNTLVQANYPILQANLYDTGAYGIDQVPVQSDVTTTLAGGIKVAVLGIGNHRVPNYEMPSDILGLTFTNPITEAQTRAPALKATNDIVVALTHIGFTEDPASVEVDVNVDTNLAAQATGIDTIIGGHSHTPPYIDPKFGTGVAALGAYKYLPNIGANPNGDPVIISQANRYNTALGEIIIGVRPKAGGGYEVVSRAGRVIELTTASYPEDARVKAIVKPYDDFLTTYKNQIFGQTKTPIDTLLAFTQETNGANLQVDASLWKLSKELSATLDIDFHLSGAMTNAKIAATATPANPYTMTVGEMFTLMPYENALVVFELNGAQLKSILERGYRNYWYYKNTTNAGGYSKYTTCMLDVSAGGVITYQDTISYTPGIDYVTGMTVDGVPIDFTAATTYTVSTVNYIAAGSCNFNNAGVTMWPPAQLKASTQYYVRDVVIEYVPTLLQPIEPQIEGRLVFLPPTP